MRAQSPIPFFLLTVCLAAAACGCVQREMIITSEPEGAEVVVNQTWRGTTPFTLRFKHYGTYAIRLEKEGYHPVYVKEPVAAPAYQQPGADFVSQVLVPARIEDVRHLHYDLEPVGDPEELEMVLGRSRAMRERAEGIAAARAERDAERESLELPLPEK